MFTWDQILAPPALTGQKLYHYTTQEGLLGVAKSRSLWTTSVFHLNDSAEFNYALDLAMEKLEKRENALGRGRVGRSLHEWVLQNIRPMKRPQVFVGSFSERGDSLSQWRAYTHNRVGVSLGFKDTVLESLASKQGYRLVKCIYNRREQEELISRMISICEQFVDPHDDPEGPSLVFCRSLVRIAPVLKSLAFEDEAEWRLISDAPQPNRPATAFRTGTSMLIPYTEFKLEDENGSLQMAELWLGPTPSVELAQASLTQLASWAKLGDNLEVKVSKVPYRAW